MSISVVIPAYNAASFIEETLESVLKQTLPPSEVLVIDDGSTDETAKVAERFAPAVRVIRRPNSRAAATRNFGVETATSEWVAFVDADDIWEPNKLERQMAELREHPEADICYTGRVLRLQEGEKSRLGPTVQVPPASNIREALFKGTTFLPSSVVIRRSVFLAVGGYDTSFKYVEDWDLWMRLLHSGVKFASCPEPLVQYRIHPASTTHSAIPSLMAAKEVYRRHVLPHLPGWTRWIAYSRFLSVHEGYAAYTLEKLGDRRALEFSLRCLLHDPFREPYRYRALAALLYNRMRPEP